MPKQNCLALRPGTIIGYKGRSWRVIANDTLLNRFTISAMEPPMETKSFGYRPGQEIDIRWKPDTRL